MYGMKGSEKLLYILSAVAVLFLLQGCDMIRGGLGMPTSEDIALMKQELLAKEQQARLEQQRAAFLEDSLRKVQQEAAKVPQIAGYHVIIGSFKDYRNADALASFVAKQGYKPLQIPLKNGYMMVSLGQMERLQDAVQLMESISSKEECPYDVWVYSARQNLHEQK